MRIWVGIESQIKMDIYHIKVDFCLNGFFIFLMFYNDSGYMNFLKMT